MQDIKLCRCPFGRGVKSAGHQRPECDECGRTTKLLKGMFFCM